MKMVSHYEGERGWCGQRDALVAMVAMQVWFVIRST